MSFPNKDTQFNSENAAEMGAKGGKAKAGSRHLSTIIREIGENIEWDKTTLKNKDQMKQLYGNNGWTAIVYVALTKAMAGDSKAMDWLAKHGYGDKLVVEINDPRKEILEKYLGGKNAGQTEEA
jgi:hypothetical protein